MKNKKALVIGLVWPEPTSSAAGWRMLQLIDLFLEFKYEVTFVSAAQRTDRSFDMNSIGVLSKKIELNNASFDTFLLDLSPDLVLFDRFITEEQYGWRVTEQVPQAIKILDAEDFHGLRKARELAFKMQEELSIKLLHNEVTKREIVAMYRCDLTLVISEVEVNILSSVFKFPRSMMLYMPFFYDQADLPGLDTSVEFSQRQHFITVGNYRHAPNADALDYLKQEIWPEIRRSLPEAELHVYGAYQSAKAQQLHKDVEGFIIRGSVPDITEVMTAYKVCLAPLRFGAGLKGKVFDAMCSGTPLIMTNIAAEGVFGELEPAGFIANDPQEFIIKAVSLYKQQNLWIRKHDLGYQVLANRFKKSEHASNFSTFLCKIEASLLAHRQNNFIGQLFHQQSLLASKYLSKWIEAKNR